MGSGVLKSRLKTHWPFGIILAVAAVLVLSHLGQDYLWSDEGDTAVFAANILKHGLPSAWDGTTLVDSDLGKRLNDDLVMVSHPWLQYYIVAGSFAIFGQSTWAARLPFALLGLVTIGVAYLLVWQATRQRWTAAAAAVLLTASVQFLLYSRQSRYYTLSAALTCLMVWLFLRLRSGKGTVAFAGVAALNFHSHPIALAPLGAMALLTMWSGSFRDTRRRFWMAVPAVALVTVPWLFVASSGYSEATTLIDQAGKFLPRLGQFAIEIGSLTSLPAVAVALAILAWRRRRPKAPVFSADEQRLLLILGGTIACFAVLMALTQSREMMWTTGVRYTPAIIPFGAMLAAITMARVANGRKAVGVALIVLLAFTKFGRLTPWTFWTPSSVLRDQTASVSFHNPERPIDRMLRTGQIAFLRSLGEPNVGTTGRVVEYLKANARPGDVVLTNYAWEPLYFHTRLPLAMTVLSSYPTYQPAKARGLPDYVFRPNDAKWIVWRRAWGAYRGQTIDQVIARLGDEKLTATPMVTLPETLWENRENLHFRRFANGRYIYPWHDAIPETVIYRVEATGGGVPTLAPEQ